MKPKVIEKNGEKKLQGSTLLINQKVCKIKIK